MTVYQKYQFLETDTRDLQQTLITKLTTPLLTLPCRQSAAEILVVVSRNHKLFGDVIEKLHKGSAFNLSCQMLQKIENF